MFQTPYDGFYPRFEFITAIKFLQLKTKKLDSVYCQMQVLK